MAGVLFLGNGINQTFDKDSWDNLISKLAKEFNFDLNKNKLEDLPFPLKVVALSEDKVDKAMKYLSKNMNFETSENQKTFINKFLSLPFENIITGKEKQFNLFRYYKTQEQDKKIWHIHGDITTPSTAIMGAYYYGKLLGEIQTYVSGFIRRYKTAAREGRKCSELSWIDSFLTKDVYIFGFGLDMSEIDIWWLIGCKKRNFPDTKIYFYQPRKYSEQNITTSKDILLKAYEVENVTNIYFDGNYEQYYNRVINDIKSKCGGEIK